MGRALPLAYFSTADSKEPALPESAYIEPPVALAQSKRFIVYYTSSGDLVVQGQPREFRKLPQLPWAKFLVPLTLQTAERRFISISSDEAWLLGVGRGQVEVRRREVLSEPALFNADFELAAQVAIAPNVLRFAVVDQDGVLSVQSLAERPSLPVWDFWKIVMSLIRDKQYDLLEQLGELLQNDPEPFASSASITKYNLFTQAVIGGGDAADGVDGPRWKWLDDWLEAKPDSKLAALLEVNRLVVEGWQARGNGLADTVTDEGWDVLHRKITQAARAKPVLEGEKPPPHLFMWMFDIAKAEGWDDERCQEYAEQLVELSPEYLPPHLCMMEKLPAALGRRTSPRIHPRRLARRSSGQTQG